MAMSDRLWCLLTAGSILMLALLILNFPESKEIQDNEKLVQEQKINLGENLVQFKKPPNVFGVDNLGEFGAPVIMPAQIPPEIQEIVDEGWKTHGFNQYVSDLVPVRRKLPDRLSSECKAKAETYRKNLTPTSIIMIFHNEAWSTLLRSVHSVLDRTPDHLIEEIILVDDFSEMGKNLNIRNFKL